MEQSYKEKYEQAIERLKQWDREHPCAGYVLSDRDKFIFPELAESDDDKIRKWIIDDIRYNMNNEPLNNSEYKKEAEKAIAWLEKQEQQEEPQVYETEDGEVITYSESEGYGYKVVKPKFKCGDWLIFDENHNSVYQVERIDNYRYYLRHYLGGTLSVHFDNELIRLWTIQDAKDGDVLAFKNNICGIIICKSPTDYDTRSYCRFVSDNFINKEESGWDSTLLVPATKEQCDLLFQKTKEAGYEWDDENKELKKIEWKHDNKIKPIFNVGDKIRRKTPSSFNKDMQVARIEKDYYVCNHIGKFSSEVVPFSKQSSYELIEQKTADTVEPKFKVGDKIYLKPEYRMPSDDTPIANTVKEIIRIDDKHYRFDGSYIFIEDQDKYELAEQKPEENKGNIGGISANWSEKDETALTNTIIMLKEGASLHFIESDITKAVDWLQSLQDRVQPQPKQEWKQENTGDLTAFENAMMHIGSSFFGQHAGLDPNDTNSIKVQANLLLELVPSKEWSEEDEQHIDSLLKRLDALCRNKFERTRFAISEDRDWLESLRPQNTYNPYKAVVESIAEMCKHYDKASHSGLRDFYDNVKVKCKDAQEYDKMFPQAQWKPSELQLGCLSDAIEYYNSSGYPASKLKELLDDLKKLKEGV